MGKIKLSITDSFSIEITVEQAKELVAAINEVTASTNNAIEAHENTHVPYETHTPQWWFHHYLPGEIRENALNEPLVRRVFGKPVTSIWRAIQCIVWAESRMGYSYWENVFRAAQFGEYNTPLIHIEDEKAI